MTAETMTFRYRLIVEHEFGLDYDEDLARLLERPSDHAGWSNGTRDLVWDFESMERAKMMRARVQRAGGAVMRTRIAVVEIRT